ncbi:MAG: hypothetical protein LBB73_07645, partial [Dysgonamonadaceae bacterium]|nr:hypothetical protein [Dysgonamonadaceae bacterium]
VASLRDAGWGRIYSFSTELCISARCRFYVHLRTCLKKQHLKKKLTRTNRIWFYVINITIFA